MTNRTNLYIDAGLLVAFLVAFEPALTGIAIHEWLSVALTGALIVHLLLHWRWIVSVTVRFFRNLFHSSRLQFVVDILLYVAMILLMLSGILISKSVMPLFGIRMSDGSIWRVLHTTSANLTLLLVGVHFALHWNWVVNTTRRYVISPLTGLFKRRPAAVTAAGSNHLPEIDTTPAQ